MNLIGPDISFYQDDPNTIAQIDFVQMRTQTPFVIVRAGQNTWIDSDFIFNWQAAKEARLYRGSYWFYDSRTDPKTQADLWLSAIGDDYPDCGLWMDFEETYGGAFGSETHMRQFAERVLDNSPATVEVGVYTGYYYWLERIPAPRRGWWSQFPLWIAKYGAGEPLIPAPFTDWLFWQYTNSGDGALYGVESPEIDLNYFNGDLAKFQNYFRLSELPTPIPPIGEKPMSDTWKVTWDNGANRRPAPNVNNSHVPPPLNNGDVFEVVEYSVPTGKTQEQERWGKLTDGLWVALIYNSQPRAAQVTTTPPTEPPAEASDLPVTVILGDDVKWEKQTHEYIIKAKK